jgi:hypothetical protein
VLGVRLNTMTEADITAELPIHNNKKDIIELSCEVGKSMGYVVSKKTSDLVILNYVTSNFTSVFLAHTKGASLSIIQEDTKVNILGHFYGDWGTGNKEYGEKTINDFKDKMLEKMRD